MRHGQTSFPWQSARSAKALRSIVLSVIVAALGMGGSYPAAAAADATRLPADCKIAANSFTYQDDTIGAGQPGHTNEAQGPGSGGPLAQPLLDPPIIERGYSVSGAHGAVSSGGATATNIGLDILLAGGNAFDAAAATILALNQTDYGNVHFGGEVPIIFYQGTTGQVKVMSGQGPARCWRRWPTSRAAAASRGRAAGSGTRRCRAWCWR